MYDSYVRWRKSREMGKQFAIKKHKEAGATKEGTGNKMYGKHKKMCRKFRQKTEVFPRVLISSSARARETSEIRSEKLQNDDVSLQRSYTGVSSVIALKIVC